MFQTSCLSLGILNYIVLEKTKDVLRILQIETIVGSKSAACSVGTSQLCSHELKNTSFPNNTCCNPRLIPDGELLACLLHRVYFLYNNKKCERQGKTTCNIFTQPHNIYIPCIPPWHSTLTVPLSWDIMQVLLWVLAVLMYHLQSKIEIPFIITCIYSLDICSGTHKKKKKKKSLPIIVCWQHLSRSIACYLGNRCSYNDSLLNSCKLPTLVSRRYHLKHIHVSFTFLSAKLLYT